MKMKINYISQLMEKMINHSWVKKFTKIYFLTIAYYYPLTIDILLIYLHIYNLTIFILPIFSFILLYFLKYNCLLLISNYNKLIISYSIGKFKWLITVIKRYNHSKNGLQYVTNYRSINCTFIIHKHRYISST